MSLWPLWAAALIIWAPSVIEVMTSPNRRNDWIDWAIVAAWLFIFIVFLRGIPT